MSLPSVVGQRAHNAWCLCISLWRQCSVYIWLSECFQYVIPNAAFSFGILHCGVPLGCLMRKYVFNNKICYKTSYCESYCEIRWHSWIVEVCSTHWLILLCCDIILKAVLLNATFSQPLWKLYVSWSLSNSFAVFWNLACFGFFFYLPSCLFFLFVCLFPYFNIL